MTSTLPDADQSPLFSLEDSPARTSQWPALVAAWVRAREAGSTGTLTGSWLSSAPPGSSLRTSLDSCHPKTDGIWVPSSGAWQGAGMGGPTECWTLSISESPSAAVVSSLSDVLETPGPHLLGYCLSPKAATGILRRAGRRGRSLPPALHEALVGLSQR